jgi:ribosomal protein L37AE/L43A
MATDGEELAVNPCRSLCRWVRTRRAPRDLFACQGCGSQWRPGEAWTPIDAKGHVPPAVLRALDRLTSGRPAGAAGSAGT